MQFLFGFGYFVFLLHLVSSEEVNRNNGRILACPQYSITENSTIASPLYPRYAPNFYCEYKIQAPNDRYVKIEFTEFMFPPRGSARRSINYEKLYPSCKNDYLAISDDYQYISKFKYCGNELRKKTFESAGVSVKLILQTMDKSFSSGGFKASVTFPLKANKNDVTCAKDAATGLVRCKAPLKRVMTPDSSVQVSVSHKGFLKNCTQTMTLTKSYQEYPTTRMAEDHVMVLDHVNDLCEGINPRYPSILTLPKNEDTLIYDLKEREHSAKNFQVLHKQFSTKPIRMCGGHVKLEMGKIFPLSYKAYTWAKPQSCLWVFHADPSEDQIVVEIKKFWFNNDNPNCEKHALSMMHVGGNMFEILQHEVKENQNFNKYKRFCSSVMSGGERKRFVFQRPHRDIYGPITVMFLLSHTSNFMEFSADVKSYTLPA